MKHPNATVGAASGSGLGTLLVWLLSSVAGLDLAPEVGAAIAGAVAAAVLFIGRRGIRGALHVVWRGETKPT